MGQCVLRDCGLDPTKNTSSLENYLKKHLQQQYFDNFLQNSEKPEDFPTKNRDFVSSLDFPRAQSTTIFQKKLTNIDKSLENSQNFSENPEFFLEKPAETQEKPPHLAENSTKKVLPLLRSEQNPLFRDNFSKKPSFFAKPREKPFLSQENPITSQENPITSQENPIISQENARFEEDLLLSYKKTTRINESLQKTANERSFSSFSHVFQNQIFENVNTTPSANYRSDDENLEEYEKIFKDDEFSDSFEEDYVKKLTKEH